MNGNKRYVTGQYSSHILITEVNVCFGPEQSSLHEFEVEMEKAIVKAKFYAVGSLIKFTNNGGKARELGKHR